jgi:hypothetical protein
MGLLPLPGPLVGFSASAPRPSRIVGAHCGRLVAGVFHNTFGRSGHRASYEGCRVSDLVIKGLDGPMAVDQSRGDQPLTIVLALLDPLETGKVVFIEGQLDAQQNATFGALFASALRDRASRSLNVAATIAWDAALRRDIGVGLIRRDGTRADQLAGPVAVVIAS